MRRRGGFTLLELMTACALTTVGGLATFTLLMDVTNVHRRAEASADAVERLRRVSDALERDLRGASTVSVRDTGVGNGTVLWLRQGDTLVRFDGIEPERVMLRGVAGFDVVRTRDGVEAALALAPVAGEVRGPAVALRVHPRVEPRE